VDVFELGAELEAAAVDLGANLVERAADGIAFGRGEEACLSQHLRVGLRSADVDCRQSRVETDRGGEFLDPRIGPAGKPASPGFGHNAPPWKKDDRLQATGNRVRTASCRTLPSQASGLKPPVLKPLPSFSG